VVFQPPAALTTPCVGGPAMLKKTVPNFAFVPLLCVSVSAYCQANYQANLSATSNYIATQQLADGAIVTDSTDINPYFANYAAIGWLKDNKESRISDVEAWVGWYLHHFNSPDSEGLYGTVYNYTYDPSTGIETSTGSYDSADAYAATFLQLVAALWSSGDAGARSFIKSSIGERDLEVVANIITDLQQTNGLVIVEPNYQLEYLIDNAENWAGLTAFANLAYQAWGDTGTQNKYQGRALRIQSGIQNVLYIPSMKLYHSYAGSPAPDMSTFYPDAVAQLWPGLQGVVTGSQARTSYSKFDAAWPGWTNLSFDTQSNPFPWCAISYAAYLAGDSTSVVKYIVAIQSEYVDATPPFPWPFYPGEGGWFMRTNAAMGGLK
jgi:hypothetical protein